MADVENTIIIGSGPAGYTAALYTSRANLDPLVIEGFAWGGLLQQTTDVENYPGFPAGIMGPELMGKLREQAERFGAKLETDQVERVELPSEPGGVHSVWVGDTEHRARTVILAMGAEHKKLGIPGEEELTAVASATAPPVTPPSSRTPTRLSSVAETRRWRRPSSCRSSPARSRWCTVAPSSAPRRSCSSAPASRQNIELLTPYTVERFEPGENGALSIAKLLNTETGERRDDPDHRRLHRGRSRAPVVAGGTARSISTRTAT